MVCQNSLCQDDLTKRFVIIVQTDQWSSTGHIALSKPKKPKTIVPIFAYRPVWLDALHEYVNRLQDYIVIFIYVNRYVGSKVTSPSPKCIHVCRSENIYTPPDPKIIAIDDQNFWDLQPSW